MPQAKPSKPVQDKGVLAVEMNYSGTAFGRSMTEVVRGYNKGVAAQVSEIAYLAFSRGKLTPKEYYDYRLFDDSQLDWSQKKSFVGLRGSRYLTTTCNTLSYSGVMNDKIAFYALLSGFGFPHPDTVAVFGTERKIPNIRRLRSQNALKEYLEQTTDYPLFTKPNLSSLSLGAMSIVSYKQKSGELVVPDGRRLPVDAFLADAENFYKGGYLIQKMLPAHPITNAYSGQSVATLRILTRRTQSGPELHCSAWKIPSRQNPADNFWRTGNVIGAVDLATGMITRLVQGLGIEQKRLEPKQVTGSRRNTLRVPHWKQAVELALSAADILPSLNVIGWDIAVCEHGPVIVEANELPDLRLHQIAEGRGIYDEEMVRYVAQCQQQKKVREREIKAKNRKFMQQELRMTADQLTTHFEK
jgi:hypothetical protein